MELIALLSSGKGTWAQVAGLIKKGDWDKIFLFGDTYAKNFTCDKETTFITIDSNKPIRILKDEIQTKLKGKLSGFEVALSVASGTGKEHMAILSAVLKLGLGVRLVALVKEGIKEI